MNGVRPRQPGLTDDLLRLDHLLELWAARVVGHIDDVNTGGAEARDDQMRAVRPVAGRAAAIPTVVVQLVPNVRHRQLMGHRSISVRVRVRVDDREEVGLVHACALVQTGDVEKLLLRRRQRLLRRGVERDWTHGLLSVLMRMLVAHACPLLSQKRTWNIPTPPRPGCRGP
jgi:hypothetical protein